MARVIGPTATRFWQCWKEEHQYWTILYENEAFVATDAARPRENVNVEPPTIQGCADRVEAHTFIALQCAQYALEQIGVA